MKRTRFLAFLCAMILLIGMVPPASAERARLSMRRTLQPNTFGSYEYDYYTLKNNKTVTLMVHADYQSSLMNTKGRNYRDVIFDTEKKVNAYTTADWVHIKKKGSGFILWYDLNYSRNARTASIIVADGDSYMAVIKLKQFGRNQIASAVRNKNTLILKYKLANVTNGGYLYINKYRIVDDMQVTQPATQKIGGRSGTAIINLKAGWSYSISLGAYYKLNGSGTVTTTHTTDSLSFTLTDADIDGSETLR